MSGPTYFQSPQPEIPYPISALAHYSTSLRIPLVNTQAANSRILEMRNPSAARMILLTKLDVSWLQTGAHTAAIEDNIDFFSCRGFTVLDTTNITAPSSVSVHRSEFSGGVAQVRFANGVAAGMTGGTVGKDIQPAVSLTQFLLVAAPTASTILPLNKEFVVDGRGRHPWVFYQNEGFIMENRVLLGAAAASVLTVDLSWAELNMGGF